MINEETLEMFTRTIPVVKFVKTHDLARLPTKATPGAAGSDLYAVERTKIRPGDTKLVNVGFKMEIPLGYEAQIRPRSGLAVKSGITVLNSPGTIDSDYRGPVMVILFNSHHTLSFDIEPGDRIAQMVFASVPAMVTEWVEELSDTKRSDGGFGSTGK